MRDFFDLVVPTGALGSLVFCFIGPLYVPRIYVCFLLCYFTIFFCLSCSHLYKFRQTVSRIRRNLRNASDVESKGQVLAECAHVHVFIIPNYSEPLSLLQKTVSRLAAHRAAQTNYVIVLAMEATEKECELKAEALENEFRGQFKDIITTIHPANIAGEARGKGSNVNYACREACAQLTRKGIPMKQMVVTVSDSDAAIPELYVTSLEKAIADQPDPYSVVYCPPIFFARNNLQVPAPVRVTDTMWSVMVMQNLSNTRGLVFPCSSYSLTMVLADKVNYWDTDFDAIGEDLHMMLKCIYKADARSVPIYCPLNFTNVQTTGYFANMHARYVQAKRHYYGGADVAYALRNAASTPVHARLSTIIDRFLCAAYVLEAHLIPATSGWLVMLGVLMFQHFQPDIFDLEPFFGTLLTFVKCLSGLAGTPLIFCVGLYEILHRDVERYLVKANGQSTRSWLRLFDYAWLPISACLFMTLPSTEACLFKLIPNKEEKYHVSEKVLLDDE